MDSIKQKIMSQSDITNRSNKIFGKAIVPVPGQDRCNRPDRSGYQEGVLFGEGED